MVRVRNEVEYWLTVLVEVVWIREARIARLGWRRVVSASRQHFNAHSFVQLTSFLRNSHADPLLCK
jgi:hypothetical protein